MIEKEILAAVGRAIEELDLSIENRKIADLTAQREQAQAAMERARERIDEISRTIREARQPEGAEVASALLNGQEIPIENTRALEEERSALNAGFRDLSKKVSDLYIEISGEHGKASNKARRSIQLLAAQCTENARLAGEEIVKMLAILKGIQQATGTTQEGQRELEQTLDALMSQPSPLLQRRAAIEIDPEIVAVLNRLQTKGLALRARLIEKEIGIL